MKWVSSGVMSVFLGSSSGGVGFTGLFEKGLMFGVDGFVGGLLGVLFNFGVVVILGSLSELMVEGKGILLDVEIVWLSSSRTGMSSRLWRANSSGSALVSMSSW